MWTRGFTTLCLVVFVVGLITGPVHLFLPVYVETVLGKNVLIASLLRAIPIGLGGITALIGGTFSDRFGRKPTLLIGMTGAIVIGSLFTTQLPLFLWGILCYEGIASGFKTAGGQSYLISAVPPNSLGSASALYFVSSTVGSALGSAIAGETIFRINYTVFGISAVIFSSVLFIVAWVLLPRIRRHIENTTTQRESIWKSTLNVGKYLNLCRRTDIRMLIGLRVFPTYYWGSVNLLLPHLISDIVGEKATGYYGAASLLFAFTCQLISGKICDVFGHRITALVTNVFVTVLAFGLVFFHNSILTLQLFGILGAGAAWALSITIPRFINEFTEPHEKGHGVGITHLAWSTGFLLGYVASGFLINISTQLPFIVAGFFLICSTSIAYKLWHTNTKLREEHL